jgi:putative transcriptional regulator
MRDDWFERTLILLCQHNDDGALGIIINREGDVGLQEVIDKLSEDHGEFGPLLNGDQITWWGGPVGDGAGFVVFKGEVSDDEGWNIGSIAVSPSLQRLDDLIRSKDRFELVLGYAGWGPGQLAEEVEGGSWLFVDVEAEIVFDTPVEERYEKALAQLGLTPNTVWMQPINE